MTIQHGGHPDFVVSRRRDRVTAVRTRPAAYGIPRPIGAWNRPDGQREWSGVVVQIETESGFLGFSLAPQRADALIHEFAGLIVGEDPVLVHALWERMCAAAFKVGNEGYTNAAVAALDVALWDLKAKVAGLPLWRLLGAAADPVPAYISGLDYPLPIEDLGSFYSAQRAIGGYSRAKVKVGRDPVRDLERGRVVVSALGAEPGTRSLMADANEAWRPPEAIRRTRELDAAFGLAWIEEPVARWDIDGLTEVTRAVSVPVAAGENLKSPEQLSILIQRRAAHIIQVGTNTTGFTGALRVGEAALTAGLDVTLVNSFGHVTANLGAYFGSAVEIEVTAAGLDRVSTSWLIPSEGHIRLAEEPGHGASLDVDLLESSAIGAWRETRAALRPAYY